MFATNNWHDNIGHYLKATMKKGLVFNPSSFMYNIGCLPDAYFSDMHGNKKPTDSSCVKISTFYFIVSDNFSMLYQSNLQTETAL